MESNSSGQSPREEGELEDGEICDDDADEKLLLPWKGRPTASSAAGTSSRCARKAKPPSRPQPSRMGPPPCQDSRSKMPFNRGPHPPFPPGHRQPCGPSGPDRPQSGQLCDAGPRSSFWERSHTALGRLRYRGKPHEGRGHWGRGGRGGGRGRGRFVSGENHGNRKESPSRKQKLAGRPQARQPMYNSAKAVNGVDESFEDLLMKYKQIQLELECIRKEERKALDPIGKSPPKETEGSGSVKMDSVLEIGSVQGAGTMGTVPCEGKVEKKAFQAFNLKPLRQKLPTPAERDAMNLKTVKEAEESPVTAAPVVPNATTSVDELEEEEEEADLDLSCVSSTGADEPLGLPGRVKDEDDELSELQLRLLALQSASKKWQQKEQQVMRESKEKLTKAKPVPEKGGSGAKPAPDKGKMGLKAPVERAKSAVKTHPAKKNISPGSAAKQAWRKQQLRTWKQQQLQKVQEEQRAKQDEEEERRKREDEIRKIRDLSNQDEQYNRFMRLVGVKRRSRCKSVDGEHRKSLCKPGLDTSGNLYQYDNYDEVAMDTDSEAGSPASSPVRDALCIAGLPFAPPTHPLPADSPPHSQASSQCYPSPQAVGAILALPPPPLPPLPPDEPEQPPKPPFADEEEEEEMLLREELLKSLANKRAVRSEDTSSNSAPPSPPVSSTPLAQPSRANLAAPSQARAPGAKFSRAHPPPRLPLVLPRHKAVVVQLNGSDDSDSESEAPGPAHMAFGGLESMIKEARRTAEAAKPKGSSASEKENNPLKTPEALPDAKKIEYRRLKAEIASREKQQVLRPDAAPPRVPLDAEVDSTNRAAAELQVAEAENRLAKHRDLLLRDELLLKHLLQQEQRKRESLRAAEAKVTKLKEQLLASEKIAGANRVLLKKLEEQVHRVQHRVSIKKHQALKMERDLSQARAAAGRGGVKRRNDPAHITPGKLPRLGGPLRTSEQQFAELIAQKRRLQQLESEYALKIQKLKEAQALRHRGTPPLLPPAPSPGPAPFPLPQPSMHDLTQDKLTLASEDANEAEAEERSPASATARERRRSFRESGFFTKPKLRHPEVSPGKPTKPTATSDSPELLLGLNLEDLKRRYEESERLDQLMQRSLLSTGGAVGKLPLAKEIPVDVELLSTPAARGELRPTPFGPYHSPLLLFRSYRFSPYFRTKEKLSLSSVSYSNSIEPEKSFCRFDLTGTCNDDACPWQHMRNCTLNATQLFQDVLSYSLPLIGCSESSSDQDISIATEKYISKLFGSNKDRMGTDQKAVLLVSKVNENRGHVPPHTTYKGARKWRPAQNLKPEAGRDSCDEESTDELGLEKRAATEPLWLQSCALDVCVTQDDERYFTNETDDISNLETSVLESPRDVQLWIKLAYKYLSQKESSAAECLDAALNTLARALEDNRDDAEVWCHYLSLFSRRGKKEELQEMCEMAVEHAPHYQVWWKYLTLESSFEGKDFVCGRMLQFLLGSAGGASVELQSFQLLECLLYRVQLSLFAGRHRNGLALLQGALRPSAGEKSVAELLTVPHRALAWLSYLHLLELDCLPPSLYDPAQSGPARIVCTDSFLLPWSSPADVRSDPDALVALFRDALLQCSDETLSPRNRTLACLPLYSNAITLHQLLGRLEPAVELCEAALACCPDCCPLLEALAELHLTRETAEKALNMWLGALLSCPHNAQVLYHTCKFLLAQEQSSTIALLFKEFIFSFCDEERGDQQHPVLVLRYILGYPIQGTLKDPPIRKELRDQLTAQMPYLCLLHCLWQSLHGSMGEAVDAFERALGTVMQQDVLQRLWLDYLQFSRNALTGSQCKRRDLNAFTDLAQRCLVTSPSRLPVPFSSAQYWNCFSFHNKVISFYLSCLPSSQRSNVLERLRYVMPSNTDLALRLLQQEWQEGNMQHLKLQSRMLCFSSPGCLANWRIAIAVERELNGRSEVRQLYRQALQKLPLCAALWKDRLLFEAADGGKTDKLRKLVARCQEVGVSLDEPLNLVPARSEGRDR